MPIESIADSQAWANFLNVAQAARTRNAAFTPVSSASQNAVSKPKAFTPYVSVNRTTGMDITQQNGKLERPALGTRFDAYA